MKYGIVITDNFNRDTVSEKWLVSFLDEEDAKKIVEILIQDKYYPDGGHNPVFFVVQPMSYKLYIWEP